MMQDKSSFLEKHPASVASKRGFSLSHRRYWTNFSHRLRSFLDNLTYIKYFSSLLISRQLKEHYLSYIGRFL